MNVFTEKTENIHKVSGSSVPSRKHPFPLNKKILRKVMEHDFFIKPEAFLYEENNIYVVGSKCDINQETQIDISTCGGLVRPLIINHQQQMKILLSKLSQHNYFYFYFQNNLYINITIL